MNKAYIVTGAPVHPAVGWIVGNSVGSLAKTIYSLGRGKLTEVQLYSHVNFMSARWPVDMSLL